MKIEVDIIPVPDLGRPKEFYAGAHLTSAPPGSGQGYLIAADANWPDWYTAYMVAEQAGTELPR